MSSESALLKIILNIGLLLLTGTALGEEQKFTSAVPAACGEAEVMGVIRGVRPAQGAPFELVVFEGSLSEVRLALIPQKPALASQLALEPGSWIRAKGEIQKPIEFRKGQLVFQSITAAIPDHKAPMLGSGFAIGKTLPCKGVKK